MRPTITLHPEKEAPVLRGHPWIYPQAILRQSACQTGDLVDVVTTNKEIIATGVYNEHSLYRVRVLARACETPIDALESILQYRIQDAIALRQRMCLPNEKTTAYRLFNSEADGLSGLTIDRFNDICVISSSAYWVEQHRECILKILQSCLPAITPLWFSQKKSLTQDGWTDTFSDPIKVDPVIVRENGVLFQIDFEHAQKTGLFLDQRDNHIRLSEFVKGARVLDLYTYTGGFALHAAKAGAEHVFAVDSSAAAIRQGQANATLNQLNNISWVEDDARNYLARAGEYDIVILDPPKLAPSRKAAVQAKNYYRFLHRELFKAMKPHALFMTCNCSSALRPDEFTQLVSQQAAHVNRSVRILGVYGSAVCHPILPAFPEGQYLTAVLGVVGNQ